MKVAFGWKAHSGWAALVVLGRAGGELGVGDRRRVELTEESEAEWAKQPYHAAENRSGAEARALIERGIHSARRHALREMRAAIQRGREAGYEIAGCGVLMSDPMPDWTVEEILAVHFRMHKAEGVLFKEALARAAGECALKLAAIPEKRLNEAAEGTLATPLRSLLEIVVAFGKSVGPPWGKDQKDAALAAMIALSRG